MYGALLVTEEYMYGALLVTGVHVWSIVWTLYVTKKPTSPEESENR